jgi:hypothetical protein
MEKLLDMVSLLLTYSNVWKTDGYLSIIMVRLYQTIYHQIFHDKIDMG